MDEITYCVSLFDDSGVKRCFGLAIVEDVSEDNGHLHKVLNPLNLDDVTYHMLSLA